jgi:hypothetical protein
LKDRPEQDEVLAQTTHSLELLARFRINTIVTALINLIDEVSTVPSPPKTPVLDSELSAN